MGNSVSKSHRKIYRVADNSIESMTYEIKSEIHTHTWKRLATHKQTEN